ncbi:MAG: hypothetical protein AB8B97_12920 [Granulosicoccus sp.]
MKNRFLSTSFPSSKRVVKGRKVYRLLMIGLGIVAISACATPQSSNPGSTTLAPLASPGRPDGAVRIDTDSQEVARLWASAERARSDNRPVIALELLYEAMELDPQNSLLWSRAAEHKLNSVEPALAENYAIRSNSLAGDNRALLYRNWLIIKHARSMRGDLLGERGAHKEAMLYQPR